MAAICAIEEPRLDRSAMRIRSLTRPTARPTAPRASSFKRPRSLSSGGPRSLMGQAPFQVVGAYRLRLQPTRTYVTLPSSDSAGFLESIREHRRLLRLVGRVGHHWV